MPSNDGKEQSEAGPESRSPPVDPTARQDFSASPRLDADSVEDSLMGGLPDDVETLQRHVLSQEEAIQALIHEVAEEREHNRLLAESIPMLQASIQKEVEGLAGENAALRTEVEGLRALHVQLERENIEAGKAVAEMKAEVTRLRQPCGERNSVAITPGGCKAEGRVMRVDIAELDGDPVDSAESAPPPALVAEVARLTEERARIEEEMGALRQALDEVTSQMALMQKKAAETVAAKPKDKCPVHEATITALKRELMATARDNERLRYLGLQDRDRRVAAEQKAARLERDLHAAAEALRDQTARAEGLQAELQAAKAQAKASKEAAAELAPLREEVSRLTLLLETQQKKQQEAAAQAAAAPVLKSLVPQDSPLETAGEGGECAGHSPEADRPHPAPSSQRLLMDPAQPLPCLNCGSALYATGRFCSHCGHPSHDLPAGRGKFSAASPPAATGDLRSPTPQEPEAQPPPTGGNPPPHCPDVPQRPGAPPADGAAAAHGRGRPAQRPADGPPLRCLTPRKFQFRPSVAVCTTPETQRSRSLEPAGRPAPAASLKGQRLLELLPPRPGPRGLATPLTAASQWEDRDPDVTRLVQHLQAARPRPFGVPQANSVLTLVRPVMDRVMKRVGSKADNMERVLGHYRSLEEDIRFALEYCEQRFALPYELWHNLLVSVEALCKFLVPTADVYDYLMLGAPP